MVKKLFRSMEKLKHPVLARGDSYHIEVLTGVCWEKPHGSRAISLGHLFSPPRYNVILWLMAHKRLSTKDRLLQMDGAIYLVWTMF